MTTFILTFLFFLGTFILTAFSTSLSRFSKHHFKKEILLLGNLFYYRPLHHYFFKQHEYEGILFATLSTLNVCRFLFILFSSWLLLIYKYWFFGNLGTILFTAVMILFTFSITDYLPRLIGIRYWRALLPLFAPVASLFLVAALPLTALFIKISERIFGTLNFELLSGAEAEGKQELYDIIEQSVTDEQLEPQDKKLIESVFTFRDLIVREVMVPRVDLFCLPCETTIKEAAGLLQAQGYSRVPIYKGTIDRISGVLMYKDLLAQYPKAIEKGDMKILEQSIDTLVKPVIFTPETKKISHLLQEFRKKQLHMAIVVDEYGGTEGIVTIEDILEIIVGDIEDEYDQEKDLFVTLPDKSVIVDPRISLLDLEEQLGITLPDEGDYDTLGGYIFHKAGEIPTRGFVIKQDNFELEVLRAGERSIEKVKIKLKPS